VDAEIKKALDVWAEYTDLNFEMKTTGQVTIKEILREAIKIQVKKFNFAKVNM
jgi:hypothetical protein